MASESHEKVLELEMPKVTENLSCELSNISESLDEQPENQTKINLGDTLKRQVTAKR